jgi:hypothetical protein
MTARVTKLALLPRHTPSASLAERSASRPEFRFTG